MKSLPLFLLLLLATTAFAQNRNSVWCFGDSAGIDFSSGIPVTFESGMDGRGSCASIADTNGNLLFYAATMRAYASNTEMATFVFNANHSVMDNGDSIVGRVWYQELVIIPNPANDSTYYLFSISVTDTFGIVYSIVDMRLNGGLGAVTAKNIQLQNFEQVDCINAIKHGNGRDWWVFFRKSDFSTFGSNNDWYRYLITPNGIQNFFVQSIGSLNDTNLGQLCFSSSGNKIAFINLTGLIEVFDFNRCTGLLSNPITIEAAPTVPPSKFYWSCEFSPDESKLYLTASPDTTYLFQYNLNASNISLTKVTLWTLAFPQDAGGGLKLAPDGKIYLACWYNNGVMFPYPYPDSVYNMYNMNLSVINQPDSLGGACDFQPYSFYLGGKRTYLGLPNNPNYDMPVLAGSGCDTITASPTLTLPAGEGTLFVYYHAGWQKAFINAQKIKGRKYKLRVTDMLGNIVFKEEGNLQPPCFSKDVNCAAFARGMYVVSLQTDKEQLSRKFVKQ